MKQKALITGIFGQDGSYLAEWLISRGYEVHGVIRTPLSENSRRVRDHLVGRGVTPVVHECSLTRFEDLASLMGFLKPEECYHLAAAHYNSAASLDERKTLDRFIFETNVLSTSNLIMAMRERSPRTRLVVAGSWAMFDACPQSPQDEATPFATKSIYGLSRVTAAELVRVHRLIDGLHLSMAILYNHDSPRRESTYVTQKIARSVVEIKKDKIRTFSLMNLDSRRDWGYARDYAIGMSLMAQQKDPDDYVLATGVSHSVEDFIEHAFAAANITEWREHVTVMPDGAPRTETLLVGKPAKAFGRLGWNHTVSFPELAGRMVNAAAAGQFD